MPAKNDILYNAILGFVCEAGLLKRTVRSGWPVVGVKSPESVAEHSFRCAVLGYCLAKMEGADVYKVLLMTLFADMQEARIGDLHKMSQRYINAQDAEDKAFFEQIDKLPKAIRDEFKDFYRHYRAQKTKESLIARDADILECLIQAKEYQEQGYQQAVKFTKKAPKFLKTASARKLWRLAKKSSLNNWWVALADFRR